MSEAMLNDSGAGHRAWKIYIDVINTLAHVESAQAGRPSAALDSIVIAADNLIDSVPSAQIDYAKRSRQRKTQRQELCVVVWYDRRMYASVTNGHARDSVHVVAFQM